MATIKDIQVQIVKQLIVKGYTSEQFNYLYRNVTDDFLTTRISSNDINIISILQSHLMTFGYKVYNLDDQKIMNFPKKPLKVNWQFLADYVDNLPNNQDSEMLGDSVTDSEGVESKNINESLSPINDSKIDDDVALDIVELKSDKLNLSDSQRSKLNNLKLKGLAVIPDDYVVVDRKQFSEFIPMLIGNN